MAPEYLFHFDSVNFALALEDFNPALHQPQPPGYPLFVLFTRLLHWMIGGAQETFVITGILASLAAMVLVWQLGRDLFGDRSGLFAALLLLVHPPFWFSALTNQVRLFLAIGAAAVMIAAWRSLNEQRPRYFYVAAAILGLASGFRLEVLALGAPILLYSGWRMRRPFREWAGAVCLIVVTAAAWLAFVVVKAGGVAAYIRLIWQYSNDQFGPTSLAFGAASQPAFRMLLMAVIWYGLPVLTWAWMLPFAKGVFQRLRGATGFLLICFVPGFLFHAFIHVGDPDHTLIGVPALCAVGGLVLARVKWAGLAVAALALNVVLFFSPPRGIAQAFSYGTVRSLDSRTREIYSVIEDLHKSGRVALVTYDHRITWRQISYYFPDSPLVILQDDPRTARDGSPAWLVEPQEGGPPEIHDITTTEIRLPESDAIVWLLSRGRGMHSLLEETVDLDMQYPVAYAETRPGMRLRFGKYEFVVCKKASADQAPR
jgi:hypothetical protein